MIRFVASPLPAQSAFPISGGSSARILWRALALFFVSLALWPMGAFADGDAERRIAISFRG